MEVKDLASNQYKILTETSPDCIKLFDLNGDLLYINPGGLKEHNLESVGEAIKQEWKAIDTIIEEDRPSFLNALDRAREGFTTTIEIRHNDLVAKRDVCLETVSPVKDEVGNVTAIFGVSRDISEIRKFKEDLTSNVEKKTEELIEKVSIPENGRDFQISELDKTIEELENNSK